MHGKLHSKQGTTSASASKTSAGSGSKRLGLENIKDGVTAVAAGGGVPSKSQIVVTFNGKIRTPQSLLPRKEAAVKQVKKPKPDMATVPTIDESSDSNTDKLNKGFQKGRRHSNPMKSGTDGGQNTNAGYSGKDMRNAYGWKAEEEFCTIQLSETETVIHLALTSFIVPSDIRDVKEIEEKNQKYESIIQAHKTQVDNFLSHPTQTVNNSLKNQNEMVAPNASQDFECQVNGYDIKDYQSNEFQVFMHQSPYSASQSFNSSSVGTDTYFDMDDGTAFTLPVRKFVSETVNMALVNPGCLLDPSDLRQRPGNSSEKVVKDNKQAKYDVAKRAKGNNPSAVGASKINDSEGQLVSNADVSSDGRSSGNGSRVADQGGLLTDRSSESDINQTGVSASGQVTGPGPSGTGGDTSGAVYTTQDAQLILREKQAENLMTSASMLKRLQMLERAIQQNAYHRQHLDYRDLPDVRPLQFELKAIFDKKHGISSSDNETSMFGGGVLGANTAKRSTTYNPRKTHVLNNVSGLGLRNNASTSPSAANGLNMDMNGDSGNNGDGGNNDFGQRKNVQLLFRFCNVPLIQGRSVTSMAWNTVNTDLLAVGYGKLEVFQDHYKPGVEYNEDLHGGLVLFWSIRNPDYPEKILRTPQAVTSLEFSKINPMILAVGHINGEVAVYDVKRETNWNKPIHSSSTMNSGSSGHGFAGGAGGAGGGAGYGGSSSVGGGSGGRGYGHADPVWQVKWVVKGIERFETLVSISTDGCVLEWNLKKGMIVTTLMQLRRNNSSTGMTGNDGGWISRISAGLCFDFVPSLDSNTYIVATEEGTIHRCSVSYNEQYLDSYTGHHGPVYHVRFSQRWNQLFLSVSADWMIHLYHLAIKTPLLTMKTSGEDFAVNDVCWCPNNSTIFATITANSKLMIWDLSWSSIDPVAVVDTVQDEAEYCEQNSSMLDEANAKKDTTTPANRDTQTPSAEGLPTTAAATSGAFDFAVLSGDDNNNAKASQSAVTRLMNSYNTTSDFKQLTSIQFHEKSPIIAVGNNTGTVLIYRVIEPQTVTHDGPWQQMEKLKNVVLKQIDPIHVTKLAALDETKRTSSESGITPGNEDTGDMEAQSMHNGHSEVGMTPTPKRKAKK